MKTHSRNIHTTEFLQNTYIYKITCNSYCASKTSNKLDKLPILSSMIRMYSHILAIIEIENSRIGNGGATIVNER